MNGSYENSEGDRVSARTVADRALAGHSRLFKAVCGLGLLGTLGLAGAGAAILSDGAGRRAWIEQRAQLTTLNDELARSRSSLEKDIVRLRQEKADADAAASRATAESRQLDGQLSDALQRLKASREQETAAHATATALEAETKQLAQQIEGARRQTQSAERDLDGLRRSVAAAEQAAREAESRRKAAQETEQDAVAKQKESAALLQERQRKLADLEGAMDRVSKDLAAATVQLTTTRAEAGNLKMAADGARADRDRDTTTAQKAREAAADLERRRDDAERQTREAEEKARTAVARSADAIKVQEGRKKDLDDAMDRVSKDLAAATIQLTATRTEAGNLKVAADGARAERDRDAAAGQKARDAMADLERRRDDAERQARDTEEKTRTATGRLAEVAKKFEAAQKELETAQAGARTAEGQAAESRGARDRVAEEVARMRAEVDRLQSVRQELVEREKAVAVARTERDEAERRRAVASEAAARAEGRRQEAESAALAAEARIKLLEEKAAKLATPVQGTSFQPTSPVPGAVVTPAVELQPASPAR
ncbi:hypothetical protein [Azospirillum palustre]